MSSFGPTDAHDAVEYVRGDKEWSFTVSELRKIRRCANRCFFCFVDGLPNGLRESLYVKDDDFFHSFLFGNFITLTNMRGADWKRLEAQRLSPLYVSVHATDTDLRRRILGNPNAPDILEQLKRLGGMRIQVHAQIVLCRGVNDGEHLTRTIEDLASLHPTVQTIAVVPVGITRHTIEKKGDSIPRFSPAEAAEIVRQVTPLQKRFRRQLGITLVHLADEFYLLSDIPLPSAGHYDEFPQLENGIGMTRRLLDEWKQLKRKLLAPVPDESDTDASKGSDDKYSNTVGRALFQRPGVAASRKRRAVVVTGTLIAPTISRIIKEINEICSTTIEHVPVTNEFFGPTVTVSGLLTGTDVMSALRQRDRIELLVIPPTMLRTGEQSFLDGLTPRDIAREIRAEVVSAPSLHELLAAVAA